MIIRPFLPSDYDAAYALWARSEGVGLSEADRRESIHAYLARNPGMSFVADDGGIVGTLLCGHDGRRGLIHHLVTAPSHRRRGIGRKLVESGLAALRGAGIDKCHLIVIDDNEEGKAFWRRVGAKERHSLSLFSVMSEPGLDPGR